VELVRPLQFRLVLQRANPLRAISPEQKQAESMSLEVEATGLPLVRWAELLIGPSLPADYFPRCLMVKIACYCRQ